MPALSNPKHECFAQALAKGRTQLEAYVEAGYKANDGNAATLKGNQRVAERVAEIQTRAAVRVEVDKAWVMERLKRNALMCLGEEPLMVPGAAGEPAAPEYKRDPSAANTALQLLGKELGMFIERSITAETTVEDMLDSLDGRTPAEPSATAH